MRDTNVKNRIPSDVTAEIQAAMQKLKQSTGEYLTYQWQEMSHRKYSAETARDGGYNTNERINDDINTQRRNAKKTYDAGILLYADLAKLEALGR